MFAKGYTPNWSEEDFVIKKVKNTVCGHMLLVIFYKKRTGKTSQKEFIRAFAFTSYRIFIFRKKRGLELVFLPHFLHDF